jgi:HEPN domain-containing protein
MEHESNIGVSIIREGYYDKAVCYLQQAVEKAIKALLISFGEFKKTHFAGEILVSRLRSIELNNEWKEKLYDIAKICDEIDSKVT